MPTKKKKLTPAAKRALKAALPAGSPEHPRVLRRRLDIHAGQIAELRKDTNDCISAANRTDAPARLEWLGRTVQSLLVRISALEARPMPAPGWAPTLIPFCRPSTSADPEPRLPQTICRNDMHGTNLSVFDALAAGLRPGSTDLGNPAHLRTQQQGF